MTKRFFLLAFSIILSVSSLDYSYGQNYDARVGRYVSVAPFDQKMIRHLKYNLDRLTIEYCQRNSFYKRNGNNDKLYLTSEVDFPVILKGDTTRIKWIFDNSVITHIEVEGVGETTPEDIQKGQFVITVTPEQTMLYKAHIHIKHVDGTVSVTPELANRRVIVVSDRKTQAQIMENAGLHWINHDNKNLSRYMDSQAGGVREGKWTYFPDKLNTYIENVSGLNPNVEPVTEKIPDTKTILRNETKKFDSFELEPGKWMRTTLEHAVIARGNSSRIKFVFDNKVVKGIEVQDVEKASSKDIRKGEYIVTLTPEKTTLVKSIVFTERDGKQRQIPANYRIIVVDPEKYDEVMKKIYKLIWVGGYREYLNELAEGVPDM